MGFDIDGYFFNGEVIFRLSLAVQIGVGRIINKDGLYTGLVRSWYGLCTEYLRDRYQLLMDNEQLTVELSIHNYQGSIYSTPSLHRLTE